MCPRGNLGFWHAIELVSGSLTTAWEVDVKVHLCSRKSVAVAVGRVTSSDARVLVLMPGGATSSFLLLVVGATSFFSLYI